MLAMGRALMMRGRSCCCWTSRRWACRRSWSTRSSRSSATSRREGVTILLVEQNAKLALEVADRGYVMESGEITIAGEAARPAARPEGARRLPRRSGLIAALELRHRGTSHFRQRQPSSARRLRSTARTAAARDPRRARAARARLVCGRDAAVEARTGRRSAASRSSSLVANIALTPRAGRRHRARAGAAAAASNAACCTRASPPIAATGRACAISSPSRPLRRARRRPSSRRRSSCSPPKRSSRRRRRRLQHARAGEQRGIDLRQHARRDVCGGHRRVAAADVRAVRGAVRRRRLSRGVRAKRRGVRPQRRTAGALMAHCRSRC